ncbi:MAG: RnfABCDGE type electron transport complex subunit B [Lachnospiraceae bacterium]
MNIAGILIATVTVAVIGLLIGLFLGIAAIKFKVEVDENEEKILGILPGNNCGGCGFPGCSGLAGAIAKNEATSSACPVCSDELRAQINAIMGTSSEKSEKMVAFVACQGTTEAANVDYEYHGVEDCAMLNFVPNGGPKTCNHGCLGYGNCIKVCPFDAIDIIDGIAVVNKEACKACKKCIDACPKKLIDLVPYHATCKVSCKSKDKGPVVMKACSVGCIGCQLCKKNCPCDAIVMEGFYARIDYEKCSGCGICKEKCPKKCIV